MRGPANCKVCGGDGCEFTYPVPGKFALTACTACTGLGKTWSDGSAPTRVEAERWILSGVVSTSCSAAYRRSVVGAP